MKIIEPSVEIMQEIDGDKILKHLELCARNCYKSEGNITEDTSSAIKMINKLIELDHTAMLEHYNVTVRFICDVGVYKDIIDTSGIVSTTYKYRIISGGKCDTIGGGPDYFGTNGEGYVEESTYSWYK